MLAHLEGVDTRTLEKPDAFHGEEAGWGHWSTVARAYSRLCVLQLAVSILGIRCCSRGHGMSH